MKQPLSFSVALGTKGIENFPFHLSKHCPKLIAHYLQWEIATKYLTDEQYDIVP